MKKLRDKPGRETQRLKRDEFETFIKRPQVESWRALMGAFQKIYRTLEQELLKDDCSISRFQILLLLYFDGPLPASEMARKLFVTRGNISTFLRRLESDKLSYLIPTGRKDGHGRTLIDLTDTGVKLFEKIFPDHIERVLRLMPRLDPKFLATLIMIAQKD